MLFLPKHGFVRIGPASTSIHDPLAAAIVAQFNPSDSRAVSAPSSLQSASHSPNRQPSTDFPPSAQNDFDFESDLDIMGAPHRHPIGPPKPPVAHLPRIYGITATALGAGMWFWVMYRAKKEGAVLLGLKHPWDH